MHDALSNTGVWVELPTHPVYAGETLTISLYANTNTYALSTFNIVLDYEESALSYVTTDEANPYSITTGTSSLNKINMLGSSPMDTENSLITGTQIHLGDVVFNVVRIYGVRDYWFGEEFRSTLTYVHRNACSNTHSLTPTGTR